MNKDFFFVLGGEDNEMVEIKRILEKKSLPYWQPQLDWGTIVVKDGKLPVVARDKQVVFVECRPGGVLQEKLDWQVIDHHNELSDQPASLLQVLDLLGKKPTFRQSIIASIDADFLRPTIERWPDKKDRILDIWEQGYKKGFSREKDYQLFKDHCRLLFEKAKQEPLAIFKSKRRKGLLLVEQSPQSYTMIAGMADVEGYDCIQTVAKLDSEKVKPCFYQGNEDVVKKISNIDWERKYWGRRYIGVRTVPASFVEAVKSGYGQLLEV